MPTRASLAIFTYQYHHKLTVRMFIPTTFPTKRSLEFVMLTVTAWRTIWPICVGFRPMSFYKAAAIKALIKSSSCPRYENITALLRARNSFGTWGFTEGLPTNNTVPFRWRPVSSPFLITRHSAESLFSAFIRVFINWFPAWEAGLFLGFGLFVF